MSNIRRYQILSKKPPKCHVHTNEARRHHCLWISSAVSPHQAATNFSHIQIILRLYSTPSEVLAGFDVDPCSVGFNGNEVFGTPRACISITTQSMTVDLSRRSPSYEMRLAKYARRGYEIFLPDLRREEIDSAVCTQANVRTETADL